MSNSHKIRLNQILSPSEFYFQFEHGEFRKEQDKARQKVTQIERKLQSIIRQKQSEEKDVQAGEIIACHMSHWNKHVRAKILDHYFNGKYKVFLVDYGFEMHVTKIYTISDDLKEDYHLVRKGSVGISSHSSNWNQSSINLCKEMCELKNVEIRLVLSLQKDEIFIGDLFVLSPMGNFSFTERLKDCETGLKSETNFDKIFNTMMSSTYPKPISPHKKLDEELTFAKISQILFNECNFKEPAGLIVHGDNLKAPWTRTDDAPFHSLIKKEMANVSLTDIQSCMFPQIYLSYRHVIIVSSSEADLTSQYLPAFINNLIQNPIIRSKPEHMGPIAIIFAHSASRVSEIAKMCFNLVKDLKIVEAVGLCNDKKSELINGCDLLIVTPPSFVRLIENISLQIIDVNRLKYVAFDEFDQIATRCSAEINRILSLCYASCDKTPQIILTSRTFMSEIKLKFLQKLPVGKVVVCFDDYFEASIYAGMEIKLEICESVERKMDNLKGENSVVVVKDEETVQFLKEEMPNLNVTTDASLDGLRNAENLIHFSMPKNQRIFNKRFQLMTEKIHEKLKEGDVKLTTKVLLDDENFSEFETLLNFLVTRKLVKDENQVLKNLKANREKVKCDRNIKLCSKLLMFGECNDQYCSQRHLLCESDKFNHFIDDFVKFSLVSVSSPVDFVIRVHEHCKNGKWKSLNDERKKIESILSNDLQKFCEGDGNLLQSKKGRIGDIYAKYDKISKQWIRGRLIERTPSVIVKLYHIDQGTIEHANELQLKCLPSEFTNLSPLLYKLHIVNLIPLDGELNYTKNDTEKLEAAIETLPKNLTFMCKVKMAFNSTLFADTFEGKNAKNVIKFQLKTSHLKLGLSEIDEKVTANLKKLLKCENESPEVPLEMPKNPPKLIEAFDKLSIAESWKELKCGNSYSFTLAYYESPNSFFITIDSSENFIWKQWMKKIEDFSAIKALDNVSTGNSCLVFDENINKRAKIISIDGYKIQLLLVDSGKVIWVTKDEIFYLPKDLQTYNFQTIHCSILGIKPRFNMNFWPAMQKSMIKDLLQDRDWTLQIIRKNHNQHNFLNFGLNSYEVFLIEEETGRYFHEIAVEKYYASADKAIDEIKVPKIEDESEDFDEENSDFSSEDKISLAATPDSGHESEPSFNLKGFQQLLDVYQQTMNEQCKGEEIIKAVEFNRENSTINLPSLSYLFVHPQIEWRQNENYLYLLVKAQDCKDYSIEISEFSFDLSIEYTNRKSERAIIQLYGVIKPSFCSHSCSGGNIILRLMKQKCNRIWPRLTQNKSDSKHIKFSDENMPFLSFVETTSISSTSTVTTYIPAGFESDNESNDEAKQFDYFSDED